MAVKAQSSHIHEAFVIASFISLVFLFQEDVELLWRRQNAVMRRAYAGSEVIRRVS